MSRTRLVYLIPPDRKITIVFDPSRIPKPMCSLSASVSLPPPPSRTSGRSGSPRSTTIALVSPALSSALRQICERTLASEKNYPSKKCSLCARKMASVWPRNSVRSNTWSAVPWPNTSLRTYSTRFVASNPHKIYDGIASCELKYWLFLGDRRSTGATPAEEEAP